MDSTTARVSGSEGSRSTRSSEHVATGGTADTAATAPNIARGPAAVRASRVASRLSRRSCRQLMRRSNARASTAPRVRSSQAAARTVRHASVQASSRRPIRGEARLPIRYLRRPHRLSDGGAPGLVPDRPGGVALATRSYGGAGEEKLRDRGGERGQSQAEHPSATTRSTTARSLGARRGGLASTGIGPRARARAPAGGRGGPPRIGAGPAGAGGFRPRACSRPGPRRRSRGRAVLRTGPRTGPRRRRTDPPERRRAGRACCSGAMYAGVPITAPVPVSCVGVECSGGHVARVEPIAYRARHVAGEPEVAPARSRATRGPSRRGRPARCRA